MQHQSGERNLDEVPLRKFASVAILYCRNLSQVAEHAHKFNVRVKRIQLIFELDWNRRLVKCTSH
jgi:hypothetical protein